MLGVEGDVGLGDVNGKGVPAPQQPVKSTITAITPRLERPPPCSCGFAVDKALFFVAGGLAVREQRPSAWKRPP